MIRQLAIWLCLSLFFGQCTNGSSKPGTEPDNLIDETKMAIILTDVHLAEAKISKMGIGSTDTTALLFKRLHTQTLKKLDVDTASYSQSFVYYSARPEKLARIYEQVVEKLKVIAKEKEAEVGRSKPKPQ